MRPSLTLSCDLDTALMMTDQTFIRNLQEHDFHDGVVFRVAYRNNVLRSLFNKREVTILVNTQDLRLFTIGFQNIQAAIINQAEGMVLSSISEMSATPPFRRFVFVNREKQTDSCLEVVAQGISITELTDDDLFFGCEDPEDRKRRGDALHERLRETHPHNR